MPTVEVSVEGQIGRLEFNRPDVMNAVNPEVLRGLRAGLAHVEDAGARVCVLSGRGGKAFSAGADLEDMLDLTDEQARSLVTQGMELTRSLEASPCVTIAAVHGFALGGGTEIALACDIRLASPSARFGLPEVKVGIFPGWGGIVRLPRCVPSSLALDMILSGRTIDATEALGAGLVSGVYEDVVDAALVTADRMLAAGPEAQRLARRVAHETMQMPLDAALSHALEEWLVLAGSSERVEGHRAFLERRTPNWVTKREVTA
jgi:enoyl-CoA hydratase/carnithine racemase